MAVQPENLFKRNWHGLIFFVVILDSIVPFNAVIIPIHFVVEIALQ
jgi:hypothetical protein